MTNGTVKIGARLRHAQYPDSETPSNSHCREMGSSLACLASEMCL